MSPVNPESEDSWRVRDSQERNRWKWSDKNRQRKDGIRGETLRTETDRECQKQPEGSRRETARNSQKPANSEFPEAVFPIQQHSFGGQVT